MAVARITSKPKTLSAAGFTPSTPQELRHWKQPLITQTGVLKLPPRIRKRLASIHSPRLPNFCVKPAALSLSAISSQYCMFYAVSGKIDLRNNEEKA